MRTGITRKQKYLKATQILQKSYKWQGLGHKDLGFPIEEVAAPLAAADHLGAAVPLGAAVHQGAAALLGAAVHQGAEALLGVAAHTGEAPHTGVAA